MALHSFLPLPAPAPIPCLQLLAAPTAAQVGGSWDSALQTQGAGSFDHHGQSVASAGDVDADGVEDFVVGAPNLFGYSGRLAYAEVYSGLDGGLLLRLESGEPGDEFGAAVAAAGDLDGDGHGDLIVGAPKATATGLVRCGVVRVYSGADGQQLFEWHADQADSSLGTSVACAGDVDGDGVPDLIAGMPDYDHAGLPSSGAAVVWSGATGQQLLRFSGAHSWGELGAAVSTAGDIDGDGLADLFVGRPAGLASTARGAAFVFAGADGSVLRQFVSPRVSGSLGESVACLDDLDGDGVPELLAGDPTADPLGRNMAGSVLLFSGATGVLSHRIDGQKAVSWLGKSAASAGDLNGDGVGDFVIGAPGAEVLTGAAFVYSGADLRLLRRFDGVESGDQLGLSVGGAGASGLILGVPNRDHGGQTSAGETQVWKADPFLYPSAVALSAAAGGMLAYQLDFPTGAGYDEFKLLVSAHGTGPIDLFGLQVPLGYDRALVESFFGNYPSQLLVSNAQGRLDGSGQAVAYLGFHPGAMNRLVGSTLYLAAICGPSHGLADHSSMAVPLIVAP